MSAPVKVLVVDDSAFARKVVREILSGHAGIEVVGTARDGLDALEKIGELRPDVLTLDLLMPGLDGIGLLRALPENGPRVVVVSTTDLQSDMAIEALSSGAFDVVHKPTALATHRLYEMSSELVAKVLAAKEASFRRESAPVPVAAYTLRPLQRDIVVVGTSTGGPHALTRLITALPVDFPIPIAIVLHIPAGYTEAIAQRLDRASQITVMEACEGLELRPALAVIARAGSHLMVGREASRLVLHVDPQSRGKLHCPSVDVLFESAAQQCGDRTLGVVLTGMGDDGLLGSRSIRAAGGAVLTETAASAVVYGMPRAVWEAELSNGQADIDTMARLILQWI